MKKLLIVAATAGLMSLAACNGGTENTATEAAIDNHEANAAIYEDAADNTANAAVENVLENAADVEENKADALEANAQ
ncbi:hypothetical protein [Sphingomonas sp. S2-65]|uniref:hypothetical protein n=1 Tax=Sphingomonas sp. S2-65 TaxID=2903960 RepID=UPI001F28B48B|nr:hypothetical protein [Sphingomonas sp. S2-65]UYY59066.1 hypothetical protein LZ586_02905 [Sphingomonas sp. S2-65]